MPQSAPIHAEISTYTIKPVRAEAAPKQPEFIRLPPPRGRCPYTGLSRTSLQERLPFVKHVRLRKSGSSRGIVLIHYASLLAYLRSRMTHPKAEPLFQKGKRRPSKKEQVLPR